MSSLAVGLNQVRMFMENLWIVHFSSSFWHSQPCLKSLYLSHLKWQTNVEKTQGQFSLSADRIFQRSFACGFEDHMFPDKIYCTVRRGWTEGRVQKRCHIIQTVLFFSLLINSSETTQAFSYRNHPDHRYLQKANNSDVFAWEVWKGCDGTL